MTSKKLSFEGVQSSIQETLAMEKEIGPKSNRSCKEKISKKNGPEGN